MLSEEEYRNILEKWVSGITSEVSFWDAYMGSKGAIGSHKWDEVIANDRLFRLEEELETPTTRFLDVGSGPFSRCGSKTEKTDLELVAVDALAHAYERLKISHGINTGIKPIFGFAEILSDIFPSEHFDIVHMSNSLDHCIDPLLGLYNLLHVCKIGGKIILRHAKNEAQTENYDGLHQWNLCVENSRFLIWREGLRIDVQSLFDENASVEIFENVFELPERRWKHDKVIIRKQCCVEIPQNSFKKICFQKLTAAVLDLPFNAAEINKLHRHCEMYKKELLLYKKQFKRLLLNLESLKSQTKKYKEMD